MEVSDKAEEEEDEEQKQARLALEIERRKEEALRVELENMDEFFLDSHDTDCDASIRERESYAYNLTVRQDIASRMAFDIAVAKGKKVIFN